MILAKVPGFEGFDMFLWLVYDITDNNLRNRVSEKCLDFGLSRFQKSVFFGELDPEKMNGLADEIEQLLDHEERTEEDSVLLSPVCMACLGKRLVIGKDFNPETYAEKECLFIAE
ncbi:CRISPR-associated protein Cas2 [Methanosarcina siciliae HI350]|nr:CRISPR-associated protein Cas2 [Methanosarcina siciliae HI350]